MGHRTGLGDLVRAYNVFNADSIAEENINRKLDYQKRLGEQQSAQALLNQGSLYDQSLVQQRDYVDQYYPSARETVQESNLLKRDQPRTEKDIISGFLTQQSNDFASPDAKRGLLSAQQNLTQAQAMAQDTGLLNMADMIKFIAGSPTMQGQTSSVINTGLNNQGALQRQMQAQDFKGAPPLQNVTRDERGNVYYTEGGQQRTLPNIPGMPRFTPKKTATTEINIGEKDRFKVPTNFMLANEADPLEGVTYIPGGPADPKNKVTQGERASGSFYTQMKEVAADINAPDDRSEVEFVRDYSMNSVPGAGNYFISDEGQRRFATQAVWKNSFLRDESGALISDEELEEADETYFRVPGNSKATIKKKAELRKIKEDAMLAKAGRAAPKEVESKELNQDLGGYTREQLDAAKIEMGGE